MFFRIIPNTKENHEAAERPSIPESYQKSLNLLLKLDFDYENLHLEYLRHM